MPLVLGHARAMKAIHGGKAQTDTLAARNIAVLRRGGMLPQASVYPAAMRAPRDWRRRRFPLTRHRAELLTHGPQTNWPYNLPEIGKPLADTANRDGVAERFPEPAGQTSVAGEIALMASDAQLRREVEWRSVQPAKPHPAPPLSRRHSIPGLGKIESVVLRYEIPDRTRFPQGQAFVAYGRRVTCAKEAAGTRDGPSGATIGQTSRTWAFSEAAVLLLRNHPAAQTSLARLEPTHGQGNALTSLAPKVARAVYALRKRDPAFARPQGRNS
jgi:Transposase IS116/IS110/IS902 family